LAVTAAMVQRSVLILVDLVANINFYLIVLGGSFISDSWLLSRRKSRETLDKVAADAIEDHWFRYLFVTI